MSRYGSNGALLKILTLVLWWCLSCLLRHFMQLSGQLGSHAQHQRPAPHAPLKGCRIFYKGTLIYTQDLLDLRKTSLFSFLESFYIENYFVFYSPILPGGHLQVYFPSSSTQVLPSAQSFTRQSSSFTSQLVPL